MQLQVERTLLVASFNLLLGTLSVPVLELTEQQVLLQVVH